MHNYIVRVWRSVVVLVAAGLLVVLLAGCDGVPEAGPVRGGSDGRPYPTVPVTQVGRVVDRLLDNCSPGDRVLLRMDGNWYYCTRQRVFVRD